MIQEIHETTRDIINKAYETAMRRIEYAKTSGESMDAREAGIAELVYHYNVIDNPDMKAWVRKLIDNLEHIRKRGKTRISDTSGRTILIQTPKQQGATDYHVCSRCSL